MVWIKNHSYTFVEHKQTTFESLTTNKKFKLNKTFSFNVILQFHKKKIFASSKSGQFGWWFKQIDCVFKIYRDEVLTLCFDCLDQNSVFFWPSRPKIGLFRPYSAEKKWAWPCSTQARYDRIVLDRKKCAQPCSTQARHVSLKLHRKNCSIMLDPSKTCFDRVWLISSMFRLSHNRNY